MKQLLNYINEALIKKDTKLNLSIFLIFIPWNDDFTRFNHSEYQDKFDRIRVVRAFNDYNRDVIWIIKIDEIEKIKPYITLVQTKLYYLPAKYSKDEFIEDCKKFETTMEDIKKYKKYEITK